MGKVTKFLRYIEPMAKNFSELLFLPHCCSFVKGLLFNVENKPDNPIYGQQRERICADCAGEQKEDLYGLLYVLQGC